MFEDKLKALEVELNATTKPNPPMFFPPSRMARRWFGQYTGIGLEIGPSAHNDFGFARVSVAAPDWDDFATYAREQYRLCGEWTRPDYFAEADNLPFADNTYPWVLASHVLEHLPNPISALLEWSRVVRPGGILYVVVPHRDALESDKGRPVSSLQEMQTAHEECWSDETAPWERAGSKRGHLWVFDGSLIHELCGSLADVLTLAEYVNKDDKVGNGHVFVLRVKE